MIRYSVTPRYSPGSPSDVPRGVAERVLIDEHECYERALSGRYGDEAEARARKLGLSGIVEMVTERRGKLEVKDLLTLEAHTVSLDVRNRQLTERRAANRRVPVATAA
jgi:hypothetical protein